MTTKQFISLIIYIFVAGTLLLGFIQYNSSSNIESLIAGNANLLKELKASNHLREMESDMLWVESRIRAAIATDDLSHLEGIDEKMTEVNAYLDSLNHNNADPEAQRYVNRLAELARQKLVTKEKLIREYKATGRMDNLLLIANPGARQISNEISELIRNIYDSRQKMMIGLSSAVEENARNTRLWGSIMTTLIVLISSGRLWFIVVRLKQQNKLIEQLDASEKKATEAALVKENFMANMSHEIRTPLTAILGFTNLLRMRELEPEPEEFVQSIHKAGENLMVIINDILDLSKIEAGMMRIESSPFSVRGLLHSVKTLFCERIREKRLEIVLEIDQAVPDILIGDATRLTQILVNLIGNAIKFTEKGLVLLKVYTARLEGDGIELGFSVCDTGIGISKDKIGGIFDRFHQAEDSTSRNYGGTGLGLSIVRDLLLLLKGTIEVESAPGKGTAFHFVIPYIVSPEQVNEAEQSALCTREKYIPGALNLLVLDDNEMNQNLMSHLIRGWGLSFDIAGNGHEALALLNEKRYDVVLMDIQMPGMDGYATTRRIRTQLNLDVPIIAMTAHALAGERERCLSFGMNDYLSKPVNEKQLCTLINKFTPVCQQDELIVPAEAAPELVYTYINLTYMKEISRGNISYELQVTAQYIELLPRALTGIDVAMLNNDFKTVNHIAHDLKTSISVMGMTDGIELILDRLEYGRREDVILENTALLKDYCLLALKEARQYYDVLNHKNYQL